MIISTGVSYRRLGIPSLEKLSGHGVYYGASVSAAHALAGLPAAVIGAGNSAGQAALHLARYCAAVHIIVRATNLADSMSAYLVDAMLRDADDQGALNTEVVDAQGDGQLEEITIRDRSNGQQKPAATGESLRDDRCTASDGLAAARDRARRTRLPIYRSRGRRIRHLDAFPPATTTRNNDSRALCRWRRAIRLRKRVASAVGEGSVVVSEIHQFLSRTAQG